MTDACDRGNMSAIIPHKFNNVAIGHRAGDGYLHATAMCRAAGRAWAHYRALDTTQAYLQALSTDIGIPISRLINSLKGGGGPQGTWVHPKVAIHLAQWLSPEFAVAVSNWVFDWMQGRTGHLKPGSPDTTQQQRADTRAINKLAHDWSQRDFRRYQAWLGDHLQKLRETGWHDSAEAALAQLSVDPTLIGQPASQCPLIGDERIGVGAIRLASGWLVFDSRFEGNSLRANEHVLAISAEGVLGTVTLADCWAGPDRYAQVPHYGPRTGWAAVPSTIGPNVRAARAVMVLGRILSGRKAIAKAGSKA